MIHSSFKSLLVIFAFAALGSGCAVGAEEPTQQTSTDLQLENEQLKPQVAQAAGTAETQQAPQPNIARPSTAPRVYAINPEGPKPNPWGGGDNGTGGTGTGSGTNTPSK